jgi:hypothetical protein
VAAFRRVIVGPTFPVGTYAIRNHISDSNQEETNRGSTRQHRKGLAVPVMRNCVKDEVYIADFLLGQYSKYREKLPLPIFSHGIQLDSSQLV